MRHIFEHRTGDKMSRTRSSSKKISNHKINKTRGASKAKSDGVLTGKFLFELYDLFDFQHCLDSIAPEGCHCSDVGNAKRAQGTMKSPVSQIGELVPKTEVNKVTEDDYPVPLDSPYCDGATECEMNALSIPRVNGLVEQNKGEDMHSLEISLNTHEFQTVYEQEASFYKKSRLLWLHELIIGDIYDDW